MKLATFDRAMAPYVVGETRLLPDDEAARLEREGVIKPNSPDWPAKPQAAAPGAETRDMRPRSRLRQRAGDLLGSTGQTYLTKRA